METVTLADGSKLAVIAELIYTDKTSSGSADRWSVKVCDVRDYANIIAESFAEKYYSDVRPSPGIRDATPEERDAVQRDINLDELMQKFDALKAQVKKQNPQMSDKEIIKTAGEILNSTQR